MAEMLFILIWRRKFIFGDWVAYNNLPIKFGKNVSIKKRKRRWIDMYLIKDLGSLHYWGGP